MSGASSCVLITTSSSKDWIITLSSAPSRRMQSMQACSIPGSEDSEYLISSSSDARPSMSLSTSSRVGRCSSVGLPSLSSSLSLRSSEYFMALISPLPSVVRSTVGSWHTTISRSAERCTSTSIHSAPASMPSSMQPREFSGPRRAPPLWATTMSSPAFPSSPAAWQKGSGQKLAASRAAAAVIFLIFIMSMVQLSILSLSAMGISVAKSDSILRRISSCLASWSRFTVGFQLSMAWSSMAWEMPVLA